MRKFLLLIALLVGGASQAHYAVADHKCEAVEKKSLVRELTVTYRLGPSKKLLGIEKVSAPGTARYLAQEEWTAASLGKFKYDEQSSSAELRVEGATGEFALTFHADDDGVGAMAS